MESLTTQQVRALGNRFDLFDDTSTRFSPDLLRARLHAPLVRRGDELIWGFSLLRGAVEAGVEALPVVTTPAEGEQLVILALELEGRADNYSFEEKLALLDLLESIVEAPSRRTLELVQSKGSFLESAKRYRELSGERRTLVATGRIDLRTIEKLERLPEEVWRMMRRRTRLTSSSLRLLATWLDEIAGRDSLPEASCIELASSVLDSDDPLRVARELRFPELTRMRVVFGRISDESLSGSGVHLEAPESFEGDAYSLSFGFRSRAELESRLRAASRLIGRCDELFELL